MTKGQSDNDRLKLNLERAQNAIDAGQTGKAQRYAGYAQSDVKELQQSKDSVAETTATVATVAATTAAVIGTAGMAAPLAVAAMAVGTGVATRAGTYAALQGKAAGAQELSRQGAIGFVEGGIAAIPLGQGLGKGLTAAAETSENAVKAAAIQGAKEGFVQGAAGGGIDAATQSETWENGVMDGLGKVGTRATIDGALSMATGSLSGAAVAGIKQNLGRSLAEIDTSVDKKLDDVLDQAPNAPSNQSVDNQLTDTTVDNISESKIEIGGPKTTTNLYRRTKNIGDYSDLEVPMQKKAVKKIADEAGIGLDGIKVKIRRDPEMLNPNFPFVGNTPDAKTIELYPKAFTNKEELLKTLGHERIHVYQRKVFGTPDSTQLLRMERAAELSEDSWIQYARMKGVH